jgi:hypothetical protein
VEDSTPDVFRLGKKQLISEVFRLRAEAESAKRDAAQAWALYHELSTRDQIRYDSLLDQTREFMNSRLGLNERQGTDTQKEFKPIRSRQPFSQVRASYESRRREEFWKKKIQEVEGTPQPQTEDQQDHVQLEIK